MRFPLFFVILFSLFVVACNRNPLEVRVSRCPAVAVVGDAGVVTHFSGTRQTTEDVLYTASILDVRSSCDQGDDITNIVTFQVGASAGPAFDGSPVTLQYFVVALRDNNQIVSKKVYDITLTFDDQGIARVRESVSQYIPTVEQARRYNYEVLLGFQTDPADIVFNMRR